MHKSIKAIAKVDSNSKRRCDVFMDSYKRTRALLKRNTVRW